MQNAKASTLKSFTANIVLFWFHNMSFNLVFEFTFSTLEQLYLLDIFSSKRCCCILKLLYARVLSSLAMRAWKSQIPGTVSCAPFWMLNKCERDDDFLLLFTWMTACACVDLKTSTLLGKKVPFIFWKAKISAESVCLTNIRRGCKK